MRRLILACSILALCVPAFALADGGPHGKTLVGTLTANPTGSVTVTSNTATLTCTVPSRAVTSVAKLKVGMHLKIVCRPGDGTALVLTGLQPLGSHDTGNHDTGKHDSGTGSTGTTGTTGTTTHTGDGDSHGTTTTHTGDGTHSGTTTATTTTTHTSPPPPPPQTHAAVGIVFFLSHDGVAVRPDAGGPVLTCAITTAPDSAAAAAKLTLNGHFGIVCRLDGTHLVLSGATPVH